MNTVIISGEVQIILDGLRAVDTDENFSGAGETLLLFYEWSAEPFSLIVEDAESLANKIREALKKRH